MKSTLLSAKNLNGGRGVLLWKSLFFSLLLGYCFIYAPNGVNETDGGFLTGLAWQMLSGKVLYQDIVYVRPPLPVLLRAVELMFLPDTWAVLGERWIFYLKVGLYSWLGAAVLLSSARLWMLATFGFVVSAHCYPPMAWHTVDGILFSALGIWFWTKIPSRWGAALAGASIFASLLCKQSFYPMVAVFAGLLIFSPHFSKAATNRVGWGIGALFFCTALFFIYLYANELLGNYFQMTGGATSGGQAFQHGLLDYFRVKPILALCSAIFLAPVAWYFWKNKNPRWAALSWGVWVFCLAASFAVEIWNRRDFTAPFAQARLLFWVGVLFAIFLNKEGNALKMNSLSPSPRHSTFNIHHLSLLAVSWCASVSWGYNLPILFSTPWVFAAMEIGQHLWQRAYPERPTAWLHLFALAMLLLTFRLGYEFVYRDGRRSEMATPLGNIFPKLDGLYSTPETGQLYLDLKNLASRYPNFKTLPAFPQANFLTGTRPPLPLDWVVNRETNGDNMLILKNLEENRPVLFIEKRWLEQIKTDPELRLTRELSQSGTILDETPYFLVITPK